MSLNFVIYVIYRSRNYPKDLQIIFVHRLSNDQTWFIMNKYNLKIFRIFTKKNPKRIFIRKNTPETLPDCSKNGSEFAAFWLSFQCLNILGLVGWRGYHWVTEDYTIIQCTQNPKISSFISPKDFIYTTTWVFIIKEPYGHYLIGFSSIVY